MNGPSLSESIAVDSVTMSVIICVGSPPSYMNDSIFNINEKFITPRIAKVVDEAGLEFTQKLLGIVWTAPSAPGSMGWAVEGVHGGTCQEIVSLNGGGGQAPR